jgi:hypothetical protein
MKHVKRYQELFESQTELSQEQTEWLNECTKGNWTLNPQTGLVDVDGGFTCWHQGLSDFKGVRFGVVTWNFNCSGNKLTSLEGAPKKVGGGFGCYNNALTSLKGAPHEVGGRFYCYNNKLTSLRDAPKKVGGDFHCGNNELTSLKDAPQEVGGYFHCGSNALTSLEGAPKKVGGDFDCFHNELTSLEGAPKKVGWKFNCFSNPVSESVLKTLYKKMQSGMSWPDAVVAEWDSIESGEDKVMLAPYNSNLSPEELKGYHALARLKRRSI